MGVLMEDNEKLNCVDEKVKSEVDEILNQFIQDKQNLITILNEVQEKYGYIPKIAQKQIAEYLNIPLAEVYGVITFYSRFTLEPKGKYNISICLGTACFVKGSKELLERAKQKLGIEEGQTTADGMYSLDTTRCVGACGLAPVFTVNGEVYGKATVKKLDEVIENLKTENSN
jgi:NADH-quinone oxidoreductase E subunit